MAVGREDMAQMLGLGRFYILLKHLLHTGLMTKVTRYTGYVGPWGALRRALCGWMRSNKKKVRYFPKSWPPCTLASASDGPNDKPGSSDGKCDQANRLGLGLAGTVADFRTERRGTSLSSCALQAPKGYDSGSEPQARRTRRR